MENNTIYHFVKVKTKDKDDSEGTWLLEADSLRVINEHFKKLQFVDINGIRNEKIKVINDN